MIRGDPLERIGAILADGDRRAGALADRRRWWPESALDAASVRADAQRRARAIANHALHGAAVRAADAAEISAWDATRERLEFETYAELAEQASVSDRLLSLREAELSALALALQRLGLGDGV